MKGWSFRTKLVVVNAAVVLFVLLASGCALLWTSRTLTMAAIDRELEGRVARMRGMGPGRGFGPGPGAGPGPGPGPGQNERQPLSDDPGRPRLFPLEGEPAPGETALDPAAISRASFGPTYSTIARDGRSIRVVTMRVFPPDRPGVTVQVGHDLGEYDRLVATQTRLLLLFIPFALLVAGVAGAFLAGRALGPVAAVTRAAEAIDDRSLDTRLPVDGDDELSRLAATFNAMIARLQGSFERQRQFVADASHELRTPLTRVKLTTGAALAQDTSESEMRHALEVVDSAADSMSGLIERLLFLAQADAGTLPHPETPVDLRGLIADVAEEYRGQSPPAIEIRAGDSPLMALAEEDDLRRALLNLVDNARRHSPPDQPVVIEGERESERIALRVVDAGPGIPAEHLGRLTERFYRADLARSRRDGGFGLGLAIVAAIAAQHGGEFQITSTPGHTVATLLLPAATASPSARP